MRIGDVADRTGVSTRALRYYEQQGLLRARRAANGYREYDESDLRIVQEIRSLLAIGFGLEDTRPFVACLRAGHGSGDACPDSVGVYRRKLAELDHLIEQLVTVRAQVCDHLTHALSQEGSCPKRRPTPPAG